MTWSPSLGAIQRLIRRMRTLSWHRRWLALRAVVLLLLAEIAIRALRLPAAARLFGVKMGTPPPVAEVRRLNNDERELVQIIQAVARRWPFGEGACLRESLAIGTTMREREPWLQIGVRNIDGTIGAHAWLVVDGTIVGTSGDFAVLSGPTGSERVK